MDPVPFASTGAQLDLIAQVLRHHQVPTRSIETAAAISSRHGLAETLAVDAGQLVRTSAFAVSTNEQLLLTVLNGRRTLSVPRLIAHLGSAATNIKRLHPGHSSPLLESLKRRDNSENSTALPLFLVDHSAGVLEEILFIAGDRVALLGVRPQHLLDSGLAGIACISNSHDEQASRDKAVLANLMDIATLAATGQDIRSPCISICRLDLENNQCEGCFRTLGEVSRWSRMENPEKRRLLAQLIDRARHARLAG